MSGKFEPKQPVQLDPPKDDIISLEELAQANGANRFSLSSSITLLCCSYLCGPLHDHC